MGGGGTWYRMSIYGAEIMEIIMPWDCFGFNKMVCMNVSFTYKCYINRRDNEQTVMLAGSGSGNKL